MKMRYFTFSLIKKANGWVRQTRKEEEKWEKLFWETVGKYREALEELKPRLSKKVWEFFYYGYGPTGLHDASLLKFTIGDGVFYEAGGKAPLFKNYRKVNVLIEMLNYEQDLHYVFDLRKPVKISCNIDSVDMQGIGDLYTYELFAVDDKYLQLGFLFVSGAIIIVQFQKLVFTRSKIKRSYEVGDMYNLR